MNDDNNFGFDDTFATSVASARKKAKKKRLVQTTGSKTLEDIETARQFGGEFKSNVRGQAMTKLLGLFGI
jgi:hypothetical protein